MKNWFSKNRSHFLVVLFFFVICFIYFNPAFQGKVLFQNDVMQAGAMQKEINDFKKPDGTGPLWTNSMFGGMPAYQIWARYPANFSTYVITVIRMSLPNPADTVLFCLLGAYFLFCVLGLGPWLSAAGAIAVAFSSYNFIILDV